MVNKILFIVAVIVSIIYVGSSIYFATEIKRASDTPKALKKIPQYMHPGVGFFSKSLYGIDLSSTK